ncbi:hypothetical protein FACS1894133_3240 [Clostridia bacterium]|nr:hypothetical protein FACS1894133_3240 [Clostridia bacterium]
MIIKETMPRFPRRVVAFVSVMLLIAGVVVSAGVFALPVRAVETLSGGREALVYDYAEKLADPEAAVDALYDISVRSGLIVAFCSNDNGDATPDVVRESAAGFYFETYGDAAGLLLYYDSGSHIGLIYRNNAANAVDSIDDSLAARIYSNYVRRYFREAYDDYDSAVAAYAREVGRRVPVTETTSAVTTAETIRPAETATVPPATANKQPSRNTNVSLVTDSVGSIDDTAEAQKVLQDASDKTGLTVAVYVSKVNDSTVDHAGKTARQYYDRIYGKDTAGVLLYIDAYARIGFVYFSEGAKKHFTDKIATAVFDNTVQPYLKYDEYDSAVASFAQEVISRSKHTVTAEEAASGYVKSSLDGGGNVNASLIALGIIGVVGSAVLIGNLRTYKLRRSVSTLPYLKNSVITHRSDVLTGTNTTSCRISSSSGGGGFGGGGSSHSSGGGGGGGRF